MPYDEREHERQCDLAPALEAVDKPSAGLLERNVLLVEVFEPAVGERDPERTETQGGHCPVKSKKVGGEGRERRKM